MKFLLVLIFIAEITLIFSLLTHKFKFNDLFAYIYSKPSINYSLHTFFLSILIFFIFLGITNNLAFYSNFDINSTIYIHAFALSIGCYFLFKNTNTAPKITEINGFYKKTGSYLKNNWFVCLLIILNLFFILNRSFVDWNDQDEITQYGYYTRLFAQNWQVADNFLQQPDTNGEIFGFFTRFGEVMLSPFYLINNDFFIIRILRFLLLLVIIFFYFVLIHTITKSVKISLISICLIITIPELSYVGSFSLKTDFLLFVYESISLIFLFFFIYNNWNNKKEIEESNLILIFWLISLSVFFSIFSFAIRLSGVYLLILTSLFYLYFLIKNRKFFLKKINYSPLILLGIFLLSNGPQIFHQITTYSNPFYPLDGPWLNFFGGTYVEEWNAEIAKKAYNIDIKIPILNEVYILIYHTLGLGRSFYNNLSFYDSLYHPIQSSSTGWLSPLSLIVFLIPLYLKKIKKLYIIFLIFLFLYFFWVNNLQFVRAFLASSCILIIAFSLICSFEKNKKSYFYPVLKSISIFCCVIFTLYHFDLTIKNNPYGLKMYFNKNLKFEDNLIKALNRNDWNKYIKSDVKYFLQSKKKNNRRGVLFYENLLFSRNDFRAINNILKGNRKIIIYHHLNQFENLHTLISQGFVKRLSYSQFNAYLKKDKYFYKTCFILDNKKKITDKVYFRVIYQTEGKLKLYCNI